MSSLKDFMAICEIANELGLPEGLTPEEAREYAEALGLDVSNTKEDTAATVAAIDAASHQWAIAARWYWVEAARVLARRDYQEMRRMAQLAQQRETRVSLESRLLAAIFAPGDIPVPDPAELRRGEQIPAETSATAKQAVTAEMRAHEARMKEQRAREREERAAAARKERDEQRRSAEDGVPAYLREIHDRLFESAAHRRGMRRVDGFMDVIASITKDATGTVGLLVDSNGECWALDRSALWWGAFRREGPKSMLQSALVRVNPSPGKIAAFQAAEGEAATKRAAEKRAKYAQYAQVALDWANEALERAAEKHAGIVVMPIRSAEEVVAAHEAGRLVGQVLTNDRALGLRPISIITAGEMPRSRSDWPAYLSREMREWPS